MDDELITLTPKVVLGIFFIVRLTSVCHHWPYVEEHPNQSPKGGIEEFPVLGELIELHHPYLVFEIVSKAIVVWPNITFLQQFVKCASKRPWVLF